MFHIFLVLYQSPSICLYFIFSYFHSGVRRDGVRLIKASLGYVCKGQMWFGGWNIIINNSKDSSGILQYL